MDTENVIEPSIPSSWAEDYVLAVLFALVGVLGMGVGLAAASQVQMSIGLVFAVFGAKVLGDIRRQRSAQNA